MSMRYWYCQARATFVFEIVTRMSVNLRVLRPTLMNIKSVLSFEASVFDSRGYARSNRYSDIDMETDAQVVVSKDENDTTCIAFRGTSSIVDWDEQPPLVGPSQLDPQAMVHAGFFRRLGICQERSLHRDR
jgi:hypothetical protein